ncbi:imidazolonepropionase-like amidohydrolase [Nonomuraea polychroma]|uniref:Imidazolonepropionase-like amidohydrolase n=1 Tax=Nonomuraea polychroma TaxID=46176 RepID=A0A438M783_9ACTN|nr:amidohydrolase family protein [Nonomuraea polychroma]RVX41574.1 imidazolonepropionase-like amidohydrolase [Nonomuraea polychroma]
MTGPLHLRGIALPAEEAVEFWIRDGLLTDEPVPGAATVVDGGWLVPGLVDAHTHPGAEQPGDPLDADLLRRHGREHLAAGVTLLRVPGSADRLPGWFGTEPDLPRVVSAGRWLGLPGMFYDGWVRHVGEAELADAAVEETLASGAWCKIYADWVVDEAGLDGPRLPADRLAEATRRVHAVGGRVAVHAQTAEGARVAVEAGVDSLEHGLGLEAALLDRMAAQGTALVPTFTVWRTFERVARASRSARFRDWFRTAHARLGPLVSAAYEAGVTVLAGTDSYGTPVLPHGCVSGEVRHLAAAPMPAEAAIGAASWTARSFLGFPLLKPGAAADVVAYHQDPRTDLRVLEHPARVIHRGRVVR